MKRKQCRPQGGGKVATTTRYRKVKRNGHPLAQADGQVYEHRVVLYDEIGPGTHACHWCEKRISWSAPRKTCITADHLDGDKWNNAKDNLVASCWDCNWHREQRAKTHCKHGHGFTEENTYIRPSGGRDCLACRRSAMKRLAERRRAS